MADEADIRVSLQIQKDQVYYASQPTQYYADVDTVPSSDGTLPGLVTVTTEGTDVNLSSFVDPRLCMMRNFGPGYYVEYGIFDPQTNIFYPLGEMLPNENYLVRLSRNLFEQYGPTGTGTTPAENTFRMKSNGASSVCLVSVFEN